MGLKIELSVTEGDPLEWARQVAIAGSSAQRLVLGGLAGLAGPDQQLRFTNPTSGRADGATPSRTSVLLCRSASAVDGMGISIKFYKDSPAAIASLQRHGRVLASLRNVLPVPRVLEVICSSERFGLPSLVTSAMGFLLDDEFKRLSLPARRRLARDFALATLALHRADLTGLGIPPSYSPDLTVAGWVKDAGWYREHAGRAGAHAGFVLEGASMLERYSTAPAVACTVHRDLHPNNVLALNGKLAGVVDWDHIGHSSPYEDVAKALIGLLAMLTIPYEHRMILAHEFAGAYAAAVGVTLRAAQRMLLPFALDAGLDWIVGEKGAPRAELAWALRQVIAMAA